MRMSYFQKSGRHPDSVAISLGTPKWYTGKRYRKLAPPKDLIKEERVDIFRAAYHEQVLSKLNPQTVYDELCALTPDPILLCWEGSDKYCHRQEVAKWLQDSLNIEIKEVGKDPQ